MAPRPAQALKSHRWPGKLPQRLEISGLQGTEGANAGRVYELTLSRREKVVYSASDASGIALVYDDGAWSVKPAADAQHGYIYAEGEISSACDIPAERWRVSDGGSWAAVPARFSVTPLAKIPAPATGAEPPTSRHPQSRTRRRPMGVEQARQRLCDIYAANQPNMLQRVPELLAKWAGKEAELVAKVEKKYLASSSDVDTTRDTAPAPTEGGAGADRRAGAARGAGRLSLRESKEDWQSRARELQKQVQAATRIQRTLRGHMTRRRLPVTDVGRRQRWRPHSSPRGSRFQRVAAMDGSVARWHGEDQRRAQAHSRATSWERGLSSLHRHRQPQRSRRSGSPPSTVFTRKPRPESATASAVHYSREQHLRRDSMGQSRTALSTVAPALRAAALKRPERGGVSSAGVSRNGSPRERAGSRSPTYRQEDSQVFPRASSAGERSRRHGRFGTISTDRNPRPAWERGNRVRHMNQPEQYATGSDATAQSQIHEWDIRRFASPERQQQHNQHGNQQPAAGQQQQQQRDSESIAEPEVRKSSTTTGSNAKRNRTRNLPELKSPGPNRRSSSHGQRPTRASDTHGHIGSAHSERERSDEQQTADDEIDDAEALLGELARRWSGASDSLAAEQNDRTCSGEDGCGAGPVWTEQWDNALLGSRDTAGEQLLERLVHRLRQVRTIGSEAKEKLPPPLFDDENFPAGDVSLYRTGQRPTASSTLDYLRSVRERGNGEIVWKRPAQIYGGIAGVENATVGGALGTVVVPAFSGGIDPEDVEQRVATRGTVAGNNYFLAALQAVAEQQQLGSTASGGSRVEEDVLVKDLLIESGADIGLFGVKLWVRGRWRTLVLDDRFPCIHNAATDCWEPVFTGRAVGREFELWPLLFEKAWAKLHGSYEAIVFGGGWTDDTLNYLTGGLCRTLDLYDEEKPLEEQPAFDAEWAELQLLLQTKDTQADSDAAGSWAALLSCALTAEAEVEAETVGLLPGYTYTLLHALELPQPQQQRLRLIGLRSPHRSSETTGVWRGRFGEGSTELAELQRSEPALLASASSEQGGDIFWMEWRDFHRHFWEVGVCDPWALSSSSSLASDGVGLHMPVNLVVTQGRWVAGRSAGGMVESSATFCCNPSWEIICKAEGAVTGSKVDVRLTMYQDDIRSLPLVGEEMASFQPMSMFLLPAYGRNESLQHEKPQEVLALSVNKRQLSSTVSLRVGQRYTLIGATWAPSVEGKFWISLCGGSSDAGIKLRPLPTPLVSAKARAAMSIPWLHGCSRTMSCVVSHCPIEQAHYFSTARGPVLLEHVEEYLKKAPEDTGAAAAFAEAQRMAPS